MATKVPAVGNPNADLAIVGESPGRQEVMKGEPFVGESGGYLNDLLRANGLQRFDVWITNACKYKPKGKKSDFFMPSGHPSEVYMEGILELLSELKEVQPNAVLAFGNYALWALCQRKSIWKHRGSILESTLLPGLKVIPTVHPAWFMRTWQWHSFRLVEWDFRRAVGESRSPDLNPPDPKYIINPTPEEILSAIDRMKSAEAITFDTEWYSPENLAYIGFTDSKDFAITIPATTMLAYRAYKEILKSPVPKIAQNAMFDAVALHRIGIEVRNLKHDTMVAWHNCWTDLRTKSLEVISSVLTRHPYYKDEGDFVGTDDERGQIYCCTDCVATHESWEKMEAEEFQISGGRRGYEISMKMMNPFLEASKKGILADMERIRSLKSEYLRIADETEDALSQAIGYTINCRSTQQVAELIFDRLGEGKRRKRSTAKKILMDIAFNSKSAEVREICRAVIKTRENRNIVSRYVKEEIVDRDGRIRCNWNVAGTRSGRLSSTIPWWNGVPLQTIPDEARVVFIPDPGHCFIGWDYEQAEARVVAVKTRDYDLLDDLAAGIDIHNKLATLLPFGLTLEEINALVAEKGKDKVRERYLSKKTRHAMNYLEGPVTLMFSILEEWTKTDVGVSRREAKDLHSAYLALYPGLPTWWDEVKKRVLSKKRISNCFGRQRKFLGRWSDKIHREYVSWEPQSTVADLNTLAIADAQKRMEGWGQIFAHMHDGGFFQVPFDRREEGLDIIREEMNRTIVVDSMTLDIPIELKAGEEGQSWGEMEVL